MTKKLEPGDAVSWETPQGATHGKVMKKLTKSTHVKGHVVKASTDDPQYLVASDKTGAQAAHKPEALKRKS
jgi:hypothetical protein